MTTDLSVLSYEELRTPPKDESKTEKELREAEIMKRVMGNRHWRPPLNFECKICGFMPCTTIEAATHVLEHKARGEKINN